MSAKDVARAIEGVTALCLGSADKLVWVDHADASAFTDGERMYLPKPTGQHAEEYELLLALALREVAKLSSTDTTALTGDRKVLPYSSLIEEVRLKAELSTEYRGAPRIFNNAVAIASRIFTESVSAGPVSTDQLKTLAVWAASHRALLGTAEAQANQTIFEDLARNAPGAQGLDKAIELALGGPATRSSAEAAELGQQIWTALNAPEEPPPDDAAGDEKSESQEGDASPGDEDQGEGADPPPEDDQAADEAGGDPPGNEEGSPEDQEASDDQQAEEPGGGPADSQDSQQDGDESQEGQEGTGGEPDANPQGGDEGDGAGDTAENTGAEGGDEQQDKSSGAGGEAQQPDASQAEGPAEQDSAAESQDGQGSGAGASEPTPSDGAEGGQSGAQAGGSGGSPVNGDGGQSEPAGEPSGEPDGDIAPRDLLSDALAKLKGHAQAKDYSAQAAEILEAATEAEPVSEAAIAAMREVMESQDPDTEQLLAAAATPAEVVEQAEAEQGEDLSAVLCGGDELAVAEDNASRSLLDAVPARLVSVLLRELQDLKRRPFLRAASGAKVAASQVWKLKRLGDVRVFKKRAPASGIDAAVSILLDRSDSMQDNGFEAAVEVVHAFILALQRISGVRTSLDIFPGTVAASEQVLEYKQNLNAVSKRLRSITPDGGTPTGTALATRLELLLATRAEKKVIVVVTDGQPHYEELPLAHAVIARALAQGVDVIGIGIGIEVGHLFPMSINVREVGDLPDALTELFQGDFAKRLAA
jgi:hypothetical protein